MEVDESNGILSIQVDKVLDVDLDVGTLMVSDPNELSLKEFKKNPDEYIRTVTRGNTQLLFNKIWTFPFHRVDDVIVTTLPKPQFIVPREKPVPKGQGLTKWQAYAKEKGITKRKKSKLVWDDVVNKWVPRFGYRRAEADHQKDWLLEVPGNADPFEDQFEKKAEVKSERVAKNELQRLRNIARTRKVQVPTAGLVPNNKPSKTELNEAVHVAKKATASLGKFQQKLPKEKPLRNTGKKRQFESNIQNVESEKSKNLNVLSTVLNKRPKINEEKAIRVARQEKRSADTDDTEDSGKRGGRKGGNKTPGRKNTRQKKGPARKGSFKKGRSSARSKPKRKQH